MVRTECKAAAKQWRWHNIVEQIRGSVCFQAGHTQCTDMTVVSMSRQDADLQRVKIEEAQKTKVKISRRLLE